MVNGFAQLIAQANRTTVEHRFEFASLPDGWSAVVAIGLIVGLVWSVVAMYRREGRRGASMPVRMLLASLRCLVLLALAAIWIEPVIAQYIHRWIDSYTIVLVDDSSSMDLRDRYARSDDEARVRQVLQKDRPLPVRRADVISDLLSRDDNQVLRDLSERNRVKVYSFADVPKLLASLRQDREPVETDASGDAPSDQDKVDMDAAAFDPTFDAQGSATNVARAVHRSIESLGGSPLAGIVLFSDGGFNEGEPLEVLARYVEEHDIPMYVVGVGDASPPRNVRVTEVIAPENVFKEDPFTVTAHLTAKGLAGETISVELFEQSGQSDTASPVQSKSVRIGADGNIEPVVFERTRETLGRVSYRVTVAEVAAESVPDDNSKQIAVNVIDDKMRVLLVAGNPSWDYRFLSRLLIRDETFDVSCWLQSADTNAVRDGNTIIDALPATPEELFEYDAVILLDPDASEFGPGWSKAIETLVTDYGGGLLFAAARPNTPQFMRDPIVRRIVQLLPVTPDAEADLILNRIGHFQTRPWPLDIPTSAFSHSILRGGSDAADAKRRWRDVEGIYWHYPVLREKPVATVLMRHSNPQMRNSYGGHVLMATQFVGSGRSAFIAFDGSWRWRRYGEEIFNSFWIQTLRYLVEGKLLGGKKRATLFTEGETFQLGNTITVTARLFDARFAPLQVDSVTASCASAGRSQQLVLNKSADRAGWYEGRFTPDQTGGYRLSLSLPVSAGADPVTVTHDVQVVRPNIEILNTQMDRDSLRLLAERSAGGGYYEVDEVGALAGAIPDRHESTTIKSRPRPLWDAWYTLVCVVGLLTVEWTVRKLVGLL
jgi:hypothetical protein